MLGLTLWGRYLLWQSPLKSHFLWKIAWQRKSYVRCITTVLSRYVILPLCYSLSLSGRSRPFLLRIVLQQVFLFSCHQLFSAFCLRPHFRSLYTIYTLLLCPIHTSLSLFHFASCLFLSILFLNSDEKEEGILGSIPLLSFRIAPVHPSDNISRKHTFKVSKNAVLFYTFHLLIHTQVFDTA